MTSMTEDASQVSLAVPGCILWMTGLSASGKTTLCTAVAQALIAFRRSAVVLDGDVLRQTLSSDLGFSRADREENMRRIAALAFEHANAGSAVLVAAISPYRQLREDLRRTSPVLFFEIFVDAPLRVCEARDPKGLYRRARAGAIPHFTGIDDIYEPPITPDAHCHTAQETIQESCATLMELLQPWLATASRHSVASTEAIPGGRTPA